VIPGPHSNSFVYLFKKIERHYTAERASEMAPRLKLTPPSILLINGEA